MKKLHESKVLFHTTIQPLGCFILCSIILALVVLFVVPAL